MGSNDVVEIPRGTIPLCHPSFPGERRAILDMQGLLLPAEEAEHRIVGEGRDEPNEDPFLDPEDPHLKEHRNFVGNLAIVQNLAFAGQLIFSGVKWVTILYTMGTVIGGLIS